MEAVRIIRDIGIEDAAALLNAPFSRARLGADSDSASDAEADAESEFVNDSGTTLVSPLRAMIGALLGGKTEVDAALLAAEDPPLPPITVADDPLVVLRVNDAHRRDDAGDADLWTANQVAAGLPRQYKYPVPTFAPRHWPSPVAVDQKSYSEAFASEFPFVQGLLPMDNVVLAGGAAAWPYGEPANKPGDSDLFIHGIDPADRPALWRTVDKIATKITAAAIEHGARAVTQVMSPGLVTFTVFFRGSDFVDPRTMPREFLKIQVILRAYGSIGAIIHAFDVPSCCVAYDGRRTYLTSLGAYAQMFRVNVVCPAYRSTTYEARLLKYFGRGYALALPHVQADLLNKAAAAKEELALAHLVLKPVIGRGFYNVGTFRLPPGVAADAAESDYDPLAVRDLRGPRRSMSLWQLIDASSFSSHVINVRQLSSEERRFVVRGTITEHGALRRPRRRRRRSFTDEEEVSIPFASYADGEPRLAGLLPRPAFDKAVSRAIRTAVDARGRVAVHVLRTVLRMNAEEIARFARAVSETSAQNPDRPIDASAALRRFELALVAKYEEQASAPIEWWIVQDPGRQYTASRNPRIEDPALWYGAAFQAVPSPPGRDALVDTLLATLEARQLPLADGQPVFDGICPLCRDPLVRGAANSVILQCGHIFHWSSSEECSGLYSWIHDDHSDCPTCRNRFGRLRISDLITLPDPAPVSIDW